MNKNNHWTLQVHCTVRDLMVIHSCCVDSITKITKYSVQTKLFTTQIKSATCLAITSHCQLIPQTKREFHSCISLRSPTLQ